MKNSRVRRLKDAHPATVLFKGVRVVDPANNLDQEMDVLVEDGVFKEISPRIDIPDPCNLKVIKADGLWLLPGLVDMHVHLREPGEEYKETIETGTQAAVAGGIVAVASMPNTKPVNDNPAVTKYILDRAKEIGSCTVLPVAAITVGLAGETMTEMAALIEAGAVAFSDDGKSVRSSQVMRRALEYASIFDVPVICHCEDPDLSRNGVMNEGVMSVKLGIRGIPRIAEEIVVARDIILAEYTGARIHIAHVSTEKSVSLIREAKKRGVKVTAETAPHYFSLTEEILETYDSRFKVNPPLRTQSDVEAIIQGLADGTIDVIATDHAPHSPIEKDIEIDFAAFGMVGLETSLAVSLGLVRSGVLTPAELVKKMSQNPADILGIPYRGICKEEEASFIVVDPNAEWIVDSTEFYSKGVNCPFEGKKLIGRVELTVCQGRIVFGRGEYQWLVE